jgi:hypothetical protein|tara:strand:+ start:440 stop:622 length:183 start_codon:yes stop_codon:yes gene_type:complete
MKFNIPINYDMESQEEVTVKANIPASKVREIVQEFFDKRTYDQRRDWLKANVDEVNLNTA